MIAQKVLGIISSICEPNIMCLLYGILSYLLEGMQTIEKIQRRSIKLIPSLKQYSYDERCPAWIYQVYSINDLGWICHAAVGPPPQLVPPDQVWLPWMVRFAASGPPLENWLKVDKTTVGIPTERSDCLVKAPCTFVAMVNEWSGPQPGWVATQCGVVIQVGILR